MRDPHLITRTSDQDYRTEKLNLDLLVHLLEATSAAACEEASKLVVQAAALVMATRWEAVQEVVQQAVADSSTSPTFVPLPVGLNHLDTSLTW